MRWVDENLVRDHRGPISGGNAPARLSISRKEDVLGSRATCPRSRLGAAMRGNMPPRRPRDADVAGILPSLSLTLFLIPNASGSPAPKRGESCSTALPVCGALIRGAGLLNCGVTGCGVTYAGPLPTAVWRPYMVWRCRSGGT